MSVGGGYVVAVDAAAVVDAAVGGFDYPAVGLDDEPVAGFGSRRDLDDSPGLGCGVGNGATRLALRSSLGERGPVWHVGLGEDGGEEDAR